MKYFVIHEPYYALIKANSKKDAIDRYLYEIADDEDNTLQDNIIEIEKDTALGMCAKCYPDDMMITVLRSVVDRDEEEVLLVDSCLA